ncbi:hypothetical protein SUDANB6_00488 [Streptomyces sp. enrichment culture]
MVGRLLAAAQVSKRRNCSGSVVIVVAIASLTASAPRPAGAGPFFVRGSTPKPFILGRCGSVVNLVVRSTGVPIADLPVPVPMTRSPSP